MRQRTDFVSWPAAKRLHFAQQGADDLCTIAFDPRRLARHGDRKMGAADTPRQRAGNGADAIQQQIEAAQIAVLANELDRSEHLFRVLGMETLARRDQYVARSISCRICASGNVDNNVRPTTESVAGAPLRPGMTRAASQCAAGCT